MYVATKELKFVDRKDKVTIYQPGDEVIGFESWDEGAKRANLNLGWVEKRDGKGTMPKPSPSKTLKASKAPVKVAAPKPTAVQSKEAFPCVNCEREFKTEKARKTHVTVSHKQ